MFGSIGMPELIIIFVIALIIFGPRKLPELGRSLGKSLSEFKRASNELRSTLEEEIRVEDQRVPAKPAVPAIPDGQRDHGAARRRAGPRSSRRPERLARTPFHGTCAFSWPPVGCAAAPARRRRRRFSRRGRQDVASGASRRAPETNHPRVPRRPGRHPRRIPVHQRHLQFRAAADDSGDACRPHADLYAAGRSLLDVRDGLADHGRHHRVAVHHVPGLEVHRARPVFERKAICRSRSCCSPRSASSGAPRSTTTSRSRS